MIIESLLDTDLYKFTMQQCVLHQFPAAEVSYRFKCRSAVCSAGARGSRRRTAELHDCPGRIP